MAEPTLKERMGRGWIASKGFLAKWWRWVMLILVLIVALFALIYGGYRLPGTGFGGKTLWDWLDLLLVPLLLAFGAWLLTRAARDRELEIESDRSRQAALQTYLDRVSALLREKWHESGEGFLEANIIRAQTLTVLRQLDGERKALLLQFLCESGLIRTLRQDGEWQKALIDLGLADLRRADLHYADLRRTDLRRADLRYADLSEARLVGANLELADLRGADLSGALLSEAYLGSADLSGATLRGAYLAEADLVAAHLVRADLSNAYLDQAYLGSADLSGAKVTREQLARAKTLEGATLPDGTKCTSEAEPEPAPAEEATNNAEGQPDQPDDLDASEVGDA